MTSTDNESQSPPGTLGPRKLGTLQLVAQSLATNAPIFSAITIVPLIANGAGNNMGAGAAAMLSVLLSAVAAYGLAWTLSRYSRRVASAGSIYAFICRAFGDRAGTAFGSLSYATLVLFPLTPIVFGGYLSDYLRIRFDVNLSWWVGGLAFTAVVGIMLTFGVAFSTHAQLLWTLAAMVVLFIFCIVVIVRGLSEGHVAPEAPFDISWSTGGWMGVVWGMLYGSSMFAGVDSAQNLAEETPDPKRTVPRAMMITLAVLVVFFILITYATVVGFRMNSDALAVDPWPIITLASQTFGATWLVDLLTVMLMVDILSLTVAVAVNGSRGLFALGRDRRLPAAFARVSRKRHIPWVGTAVQVGWMAVAVLGCQFLVPLLFELEEGVPGYIPAFHYIAPFTALADSITYGVLLLGALVWLRKRDSRPRLLTLAASVSLLAICGVLLTSLYEGSATVYSTIAIVIAFLTFSWIQSAIREKRGTYAPSTARLEEYEAELDFLTSPEGAVTNPGTDGKWARK